MRLLLDEGSLRALLQLMSAHHQKRPWVAAIAGTFLLLNFAGCWKKSGEAVVIEKVCVPAREVNETATASPSASPSERIDLHPEETPGTSEENAADNFIGPPLDPRATGYEQWIVTVQMTADLRRIDVRLEEPRWQGLKLGDKVHVTYRQGKYTGTVWSAEIE